MFINLHVHSAKGSLLDSILTTKQIADYAKAHGQTAIALTDHGTMYASIDFVNDCKKIGIKPISGCEIYECDNHMVKDVSDPYNHLVLLVKTTQGLKNLYQIVTEGFRNGLYRKPRVSIEWIRQHGYGKGIICLTACMAGRIARLLKDNKTDEALNFYNLLNSTFDYTVCEIQSHPTTDQAEMNDRVLKFAKKHNFPFTITSDAHMERADEEDAHNIFVKISQDRDAGETYSGCHLQDEEDLQKYNIGKKILQQDLDTAIKESVHIANMIDEDIDYELNKGTQMPSPHIPEGYSVDSYFREVVYSKFNEKFGWMSDEEQKRRRDRIEEEIPVLKEIQFLEYLLIQREFCTACDKRGIPRGYSRGSAANSLCNFMLDVTQIDSVRWDLDFSRFANIGRKGSVADVDIDVSRLRRQEAIQVLCDVFGSENVAAMATFNTLSTKVAIKDIGKVLDEDKDSPYYQKIPYKLRDAVAKMIPTIKTISDLGEEEEKEILLKELVGKNEKLDKIYKEFPLWFKYVMKLEGLPKSRGRHASGTLLTPKPVLNYTPLCRDNCGNLMSMYDMHNCQDTKGGMGLCKEDILGLLTLDIIDTALKSAGLTWEDVDINHLNFEDKEVYDKIYKTGNTNSVFQMESYEARKMLIDAQCNNIEDVIVVNAANRPATKDSFPDYCKYKLNPDKIDCIHPDLKKIFYQTHTVLLYQEQALALLRYAGFPEEEVENGRRSIGKKIPSEMKKLEPKFKEGLVAKGWSKKQSDDMWDLVLKQSSYSFNRGHACSYGLLSYLCAYLKVHYPEAFMAAALTMKTDDTPKLSSIISECQSMGIKVCPPDVNNSQLEFTPVPSKHEILFGLLGVKGMGENVAKHIIENRPYNDLADFLFKGNTEATAVTMIKAGAIKAVDKEKAILDIASHKFKPNEYKPVCSLPAYAKLKELGIDISKYAVGKKYDRQKLLQKYNDIRKVENDKNELEKSQKLIKEFMLKNADNPFLFEYETLSMFLTDNPLKKSDKYVGDWNECEDGKMVTICGVVTDVQKKKAKGGSQFAYITLYTSKGLVEATVFSKILNSNTDLIKKSSCITIQTLRERGTFTVKSVELYKNWIDRELRTTGKEEDRRKLFVLEVFPLKSSDNSKPWAYKIHTKSLGSGKEAFLILYANKFNPQLIKVDSLIYVSHCHLNDKGYWYLDNYEPCSI